MNRDEINQMLAHAFDAPPARPAPKPVSDKLTFPVEPDRLLTLWVAAPELLAGNEDDVVYSILNALAEYTLADLKNLAATTPEPAAALIGRLVDCFETAPPEESPEELAKIREQNEKALDLPNVTLGSWPAWYKGPR